MMNNQHREQTYALIKTYGIILKTYAHTTMNRALHCKKEYRQNVMVLKGRKTLKTRTQPNLGTYMNKLRRESPNFNI